MDVCTRAREELLMTRSAHLYDAPAKGQARGVRGAGEAVVGSIVRWERQRQNTQTDVFLKSPVGTGEKTRPWGRDREGQARLTSRWWAGSVGEEVIPRAAGDRAEPSMCAHRRPAWQEQSGRGDPTWR